MSSVEKKVLNYNKNNITKQTKQLIKNNENNIIRKQEQHKSQIEQNETSDLSDQSDPNEYSNDEQEQSIKTKMDVLFQPQIDKSIKSKTLTNKLSRTQVEQLDEEQQTKSKTKIDNLFQSNIDKPLKSKTIINKLSRTQIEQSNEEQEQYIKSKTKIDALFQPNIDKPIKSKTIKNKLSRTQVEQSDEQDNDDSNMNICQQHITTIHTQSINKIPTKNKQNTLNTILIENDYDNNTEPEPEQTQLTEKLFEIKKRINTNHIKKKIAKLKEQYKPINTSEIDCSYLKTAENIILIQLENEENNIKNEEIKNILRMIDKGHNYLYNYENIEGEDALNDIMNFLFIQSIQPFLSNNKEDGKIDLLNKEYYKHLYSDNILIEILSYFQNLKNLSVQDMLSIRDLNGTNDIIRQMGEVLMNHPITKQIFTETNFIRAKKPGTIQMLINDVIRKTNLNIEQNEDIIGEIYEHIINNYVKRGSKLGQYFTPRKLMKLILNYKKNRIDEIIETINKKEHIKIYDSCMGTGGWLVTGYNILKEKYGDRLLLSGGEIKPTTFQYGLMNLILTLKKFPHDIMCESSLTHINNIKHHFIFTNPPFQTDKKFEQVENNFNFDKFTKKNNIDINDVYNLKNNSPHVQFLELDIFKLEENGLCIIVLPCGNLFFGSSYKNVRKYFMKNINITDIITFPCDIFTHTGVKTCVLIFEKNNTGTKEINFIQADQDCNILTKIMTVSIDDINKESNSSWYFKDYLKDDTINKQYTNNVIIKTIGDVCSTIKGPKKNSKDGTEQGLYPLYYCSILGNLYLDTFDYTGEGIIINKTNGSGKAMIYYGNNKYNVGNTTIHFKSNNDDIKTKYIYYYLLNNVETLQKYYKGCNQKSITEDDLFKIKIPIPTLELQKHIIEYLDFICDTVNKTSIEKINELKKLTKYYIVHQQIFGHNIIKTLDEVCKIEIGGTPSRNKKEYYENGNHIWVSIRELNGGYIYD